jgi:hypothetical protein
LRCEQRECSRNSRPNHGVDGKGRRGKHPTRTRLSTLMIKSFTKSHRYVSTR